MNLVNVILSIVMILEIKCNELNEEIVFPQDSIDQQLATEKPEENVEIFKVCEDGLGCIETDQTWYHKEYRPVNLRPLARHIIKTDFLLIKKANTEEDQLLYTSFQPKQDSIKRAGFSNDSELMILIHDFTGNGYTGWIKHLSHKILESSMDYNLISVDWQRGAEPPFDQAIANARLVALEILILMKELKENMGYGLDEIHIIGHGVGAHIAGYVGYSYNKIKKITGLDPSGPRFEGMPFNVKLNPRCAKYVEVIHTDYYQTRSQGISENLGHSDFFVNGEQEQPGCTVDTNFSKLVSVERGSLKEGEILPGCSHKRAFKYFIESIGNKNCTFQGIRCNNLQDFQNGKCSNCNLPGHDCRLFGLKTYLETSENNMFFLNTASHSPFCLLEYKITVFINDEEKNGYFNFILIDENADVSEAYLSPENGNNFRKLLGGPEHHETGNSFIYFATPPKLHNIRELKVRWNEKMSLRCVFFCKKTIALQKVTISFLGTGHNDASDEASFCPDNKFLQIQSEAYVTFRRCEEASQHFSQKPTLSEVFTTVRMSSEVNQLKEITTSKDQKDLQKESTRISTLISSQSSIQVASEYKTSEKSENSSELTTKSTTPFTTETNSQTKLIEQEEFEGGWKANVVRTTKKNEYLNNTLKTSFTTKIISLTKLVETEESKDVWKSDKTTENAIATTHKSKKIFVDEPSSSSMAHLERKKYEENEVTPKSQHLDRKTYEGKLNNIKLLNIISTEHSREAKPIIKIIPASKYLDSHNGESEYLSKINTGLKTKFASEIEHLTESNDLGPDWHVTSEKESNRIQDFNTLTSNLFAIEPNNVESRIKTINKDLTSSITFLNEVPYQEYPGEVMSTFKSRKDPKNTEDPIEIITKSMKMYTDEIKSPYKKKLKIINDNLGNNVNHEPINYYSKGYIKNKNIVNKAISPKLEEKKFEWAMRAFNDNLSKNVNNETNEVSNESLHSNDDGQWNNHFEKRPKMIDSSSEVIFKDMLNTNNKKIRPVPNTSKEENLVPTEINYQNRPLIEEQDELEGVSRAPFHKHTNRVEESMAITYKPEHLSKFIDRNLIKNNNFESITNENINKHKDFNKFTAKTKNIAKQLDIEANEESNENEDANPKSNIETSNQTVSDFVGQEVTPRFKPYANETNDQTQSENIEGKLEEDNDNVKEYVLTGSVQYSTEVSPKNHLTKFWFGNQEKFEDDRTESQFDQPKKLKNRLKYATQKQLSEPKKGFGIKYGNPHSKKFRNRFETAYKNSSKDAVEEITEYSEPNQLNYRTKSSFLKNNEKFKWETKENWSNRVMSKATAKTSLPFQNLDDVKYMKVNKDIAEDVSERINKGEKKFEADFQKTFEKEEIDTTVVISADKDKETAKDEDLFTLEVSYEITSEQDEGKLWQPTDEYISKHKCTKMVECLQQVTTKFTTISSTTKKISEDEDEFSSLIDADDMSETTTISDDLVRENLTEVQIKSIIDNITNYLNTETDEYITEYIFKQKDTTEEDRTIYPESESLLLPEQVRRQIKKYNLKKFEYDQPKKIKKSWRTSEYLNDLTNEAQKLFNPPSYHYTTFDKSKNRVDKIKAIIKNFTKFVDIDIGETTPLSSKISKYSPKKTRNPIKKYITKNIIPEKLKKSEFKRRWTPSTTQKSDAKSKQTKLKPSKENVSEHYKKVTSISVENKEINNNNTFDNPTEVDSIIKNITEHVDSDIVPTLSENDLFNIFQGPVYLPDGKKQKKYIEKNTFPHKRKHRTTTETIYDYIIDTTTINSPKYTDDFPTKIVEDSYEAPKTSTENLYNFNNRNDTTTINSFKYTYDYPTKIVEDSYEIPKTSTENSHKVNKNDSTIQNLIEIEVNSLIRNITKLLNNETIDEDKSVEVATKFSNSIFLPENARREVKHYNKKNTFSPNFKHVDKNKLKEQKQKKYISKKKKKKV